MGPLHFAVIGLAALAVVGIFVGGGALSLAGDVGLTDEHACSAIAATGKDGLLRLEDSGFPHASQQPVETYRLVAKNATQAIIRVDWQQHAAACMPLDDATPSTVTIELQPKAYNSLVLELKSTLETGHTSGSAIPEYLLILWHSTIHLPPGQNEVAYKVRLAKWAAGSTLHGGTP